MKNIKKLIQNLAPQDFYENVNLHIHTCCSDGKLEPREALNQAQKLGMKIISITDHNTVEAYNDIKLEDFSEITLIKGVEFDCWHKYLLLHILGYGIDISNHELNKMCATDKMGKKTDLIRFFNRRNAKEVINVIKNAGGIPVLAHPACYWSLNMKKTVEELMSFGLEGIEVYYPYKRHRGIIKFYTVERINWIAQEYNLLKTGGTDCHTADLSDF